MIREPERVKEVDTVVDYETAFELTGHGWYNRLVLAACCVCTNAVALDMFGFSVVVAAARCDLHLRLRETGLLVSAPFAGLMFAFPWGYFADVHGRRRALLLSSSVGFLLAALSSLATSWRAMLALKVVGCCFSTPGYTLTVAFLGECTNDAVRSRYMFYMNSMNLACEIVSFGLAFFILPLTFNVPLPWLSVTYRSWRLYTLVLALPLGLSALMIFFLYESPKFLANIGYTDKALDVMKRVYAINGGRKNEYPVQSLIKVELKSVTSFWSSVVKQTKPLFKPPLLWRTLQLTFLMVVCCSTNNVFFMWFSYVVNKFFTSLSGDPSYSGFCEQIKDNATYITPTSDTETGSSSDIRCDDAISLNTIYSGIILGLLMTLLNLVASKFATYRRLILISVLLLATISCILVGLLKHPLASLLFFSLIQATAVGLGSISSYFVDLYPASFRGLVTSLTSMVARFSALIGVNVIGNVIIDHCSTTFYLWALLTLCGAGVSLLLPTDRKANIGT